MISERFMHNKEREKAKLLFFSKHGKKVYLEGNTDKIFWERLQINSQKTFFLVVENQYKGIKNNAKKIVKEKIKDSIKENNLTTFGIIDPDFEGLELSPFKREDTRNLYYYDFYDLETTLLNYTNENDIFKLIKNTFNSDIEQKDFSNLLYILFLLSSFITLVSNYIFKMNKENEFGDRNVFLKNNMGINFSKHILCNIQLLKSIFDKLIFAFLNGNLEVYKKKIFDLFIEFLDGHFRFLLSNNLKSSLLLLCENIKQNDSLRFHYSNGHLIFELITYFFQKQSLIVVNRLELEDTFRRISSSYFMRSLVFKEITALKVI